MDREKACEWFVVIPCYLLFLLSFFVLCFWLASLVHHFPRCSILYFYVPLLNKTLNSSPHDDNTLSFMLRLKNINAKQGIYYDDIRLSFSTVLNDSSLVLVANYTVPRFYQGYEKKAKKWGQAHLLDNQTVFRGVLPSGTTVFRVDLSTQLKYKLVFWTTRRYKFKASVNLEVNGDGATKVKEKEDGIKMKKSDSSTRLTSFYICVLMNLLVFFVVL